jgi:PhoPQ-activated pathogenicity-related protein
MRIFASIILLIVSLSSVQTADILTNDCKVCKFVVKITDALVTEHSNVTTTAIQRVCDTACSQLPTSISTACLKQTHMYVPRIVDSLENMDPSEVCTKLKICP